jgi:gliding motility-associated-like protein
LSYFLDLPAGLYKLKSNNPYCTKYVRIDSIQSPKINILPTLQYNCLGQHNILLQGVPVPLLCDNIYFNFRLYIRDTITGKDSLYRSDNAGSFYSVPYTGFHAEIYLNQKKVFGVFRNIYDSICPIDDSIIKPFGILPPSLAASRLTYFVCGKNDSVDIPFTITGGSAPYVVTIPGYDSLTVPGQSGIYKGVKPGKSYSLIASDVCFISASVQISVEDSCSQCEDHAKFSITDSIICLGDTLFTKNKSIFGQDYKWFVNGLPISIDSDLVYIPPTSGVYQVKFVLDEIVCKDSSYHSFRVDTALPFTLIPDTTFCNAFSLKLNTGKPTTRWSNGLKGSYIYVNKGGEYSALVNNVCGTWVDTVVITQRFTPHLYMPHDTTLCSGDTIMVQIHADAPVSYIWNTGIQDSIIQIIQQGTYTVTATDGPCPVTDSIRARYIVERSRLFDTLPMPCIGEELVLRSNYGTMPIWQDSVPDTTYSVIQDGLYKLRVLGKCGVIRDSVSIKFHDCQCRLLAPTAFSPDGNGINDVFRAIPACPTQSFVLKIFNRWGEKVFESHDSDIGWDGTYQLASQPIDVYMYTVTWSNTGNNSSPRSWSGNVTLVR